MAKCVFAERQNLIDMMSDGGLTDSDKQAIMSAGEVSISKEEIKSADYIAVPASTVNEFSDDAKFGIDEKLSRWSKELHRFIPPGTKIRANGNWNVELASASDLYIMTKGNSIEAYTDIVVKSENGNEYSYTINMNTGSGKTSGGKTIMFNSLIEGGDTVYDYLGNREDGVYSHERAKLRYSDASAIDKDIDNFREEEGNILQDYNKAKVLFNELAEGEEIEPEHLKRLKKTLKVITDSTTKYIPKMKVMIDRTSEFNGGFYASESNSRTQSGVFVRKGRARARNGITAAETFVHESVHAATYHALNNNSVKSGHSVNQMKKLYKKFMKEVEISDLMPTDSIDYAAELTVAQDKLDHMLGANGFEEFVVMSVTDKHVIEKLSTIKYKNRDKALPADTTIYQAVVHYFTKMFDFAMQQFDKVDIGSTADKAMFEFMEQLASNNNIALINKRDKNRIINAASTFAEHANTKSSNWLRMLANKTIEGRYPSFEEDGVFTVPKLMWRYIVDPLYRTTAERVMTEILGMRPEGTFMTLLKSLNPNDAEENKVSMFLLQKSKLDRARNKLSDNYTSLIQAGFDNKLTKKQMSALTSISMKLDIGSILQITKDKDNFEEVIKLLTDESALAKRISMIEASLKKSVTGYDEIDYNPNEGLSNLISDIEEEIVMKTIDESGEIDIEDEYAQYQDVEESSLTETEKQAKAIAAENKVTDEQLYNYYIAQSKGLAHMMITGKSSSAQRLNARHITEFGHNRMKEIHSDTEMLIDQLTTLRAMQEHKGSAKSEFAKIMKKHPHGIKSFEMYLRNYNKLVDKNEYGEYNYFNKVKGEVKNIVDQDTHKIVMPIADKDKLYADGYDLIRVIDTSVVIDGKKTKGNGDMYSKKLGIYINRNQTVQPFNSASVKITTGNHDKHSMKKVLNRTINNKSDNWKMTGQSLALINKHNNKMLEQVMMDGGDIIVTNGLKPIYNEYGRISDYSFNWTEKDKHKYHDVETDASIILGRMFGQNYDRVTTEQYNKGIVKMLAADAAKNYISKKEPYGKHNDKLYVEIHAGSKIKDVQDIWAVVPPSMKAEFKKIRKDGKIVIRRDLLHNVFGYREPSVMDFEIMKGLPRVGKMYTRLAESYWKRVVGVAKNNIVVKIWEVSYGNIKSNYFFQVMMGGNPIEVASDNVKAWTLLDDYLRDEEQLIKLTAKHNAGIAKPSEIRKINVLKNTMKSNPVSPLMEAGVYSVIQEDMEGKANENNRGSKNKLDKAVDSLVGFVPSPIRKLGNFLWMTEKTKAYNVMHQFISKGDFMMKFHRFYKVKREVETERRMLVNKYGKDVVFAHIQADIDEGKTVLQYRLETYVKDRKFDRVPARDQLLVDGSWINEEDVEQYALQVAVMEGIQYDLSSGKGMALAEKLGPIRFMKFKQHIQRVLTHAIDMKPVNSILTYTTQEFMGDLDDVWNHNIIDAKYSSLLHGPTDILSDFATPVMGGYMYDAWKSIK